MRRRISCAATALPALVLLGCAGTAPVQVADGGGGANDGWPGWGGPRGNFKVTAGELADSWPPAGPPELWRRPLGAGYSAVAAWGPLLFTMYRDGSNEILVALEAANGTTVWEHRYEAPTRAQNAVQFGKGPNATPLVFDGRVIGLGYTGKLHCVDRMTGEPIWSHDLIADFRGEILDFGYSASPIAYRDTVVILVGGEGQGAVAFRATDGSIVWKSPPSSVSYATPIVIDVSGQDQLVYFSADEIIGLDASNGERLWSFPVVNQYRNNATGPLWGEDRLLWVATQLDGGTRALRLTRIDGATQVEEVWASNELSIHFWNSLRLADTVYASIGNASVMAAVDIRTGEVLWRQRGFEQANLVQADERTVVLDANGELALVRLRADGLEILSQTKILDGPSWTAPSLVGRTLYLRDQQTIRALDLGPRPESD